MGVFVAPGYGGRGGDSAVRAGVAIRPLVSLSVFILAMTMALSGCDFLVEVDAGKLAFERGKYSEAARVWEKGALEGSSSAEYGLGKLYELGLGRPQDHAIAAKYYALAAGRNHPYAQAALAMLYAYGRGVPQDYGLSFMWSSLAAINYPRWSNADKTAALRNRDIVAARLSSAELIASQRAVEQFAETGKLGERDSGTGKD